MKVRLEYSKKAIKFLKKNNRITKQSCDELLVQALKRIFLNEMNLVDLKKISGKSDYYRIRQGDLRILFEVTEKGEVKVAFVELIAPRGSVYKAL